MDCARLLLEIILIPTLVYGSKMLVWKQKGKSRIANNLRGMLDVKGDERIKVYAM